MRSLVLGMSAVVAAAVPLAVSAEQKTVPAGTTTTVAASDVALWKDADIDIGAGATLWFEEPDAHAVFTGKITGSGNFVVNSAVTTATPKEFKLSGDATDFTGGFFYTNVRMNASSPTAVGSSARITIHVEYNTGNGAKSSFQGSGSGKPDYVYTNPMDIYVGPNNGLIVNERAVLAGNITHRNGVFHGPGKITGRLDTYSTALYLTEGLHSEGLIASHSTTKILNSGTTLYFKSTASDATTFNAFNCNTPVYLEGDNLFGESVELQIGSTFSGASKSGRLELNGHSQVFKRVDFPSTPDEQYTFIGGIGNTGAPATITVVNQDKAVWFRGCLDGHLSISVSGSNQLGFVGPTNTIDGTITSSGGKVVLGNNWPKIKNVVSRDGGLVVFDATANINPKATVDIDSTSTIKVSTGLSMKVRRLRINGVDLPVGKYNKTSPAVNGRFDSFGNGTLEVLGVPGSMLIIE
ncbi:MAG: hypothetical protein IJI35_07125 [Kiritimatiellae bacterium]|nr:hypothetical protein [Kiritimatiellia bacterium]